MNPGRLVVFSAPSGAGKSSLISAVMPEIPRMRYSVSATTRKPRPGEIDGVHYFFLEREQFQAMIHAEEFAEWNEVHGNLYGTPRPFLDACTARGEHVVLDLDVFGKRNFDRLYPESLGILILPPSLAELEQRLRGRGTDSEEVIQVRLKNARSELAAAESGSFTYRLVNDDFATARAELLEILKKELLG
ncbi:MAG: guanylate kinase [Fibrobacteria bacterium]|nr:guanylate kinase [Fibrobacteria bacterium]